jgi:predicted transcriptional regulator
MKKQHNLSDPITLRLPLDVLQEVEEIAALCDRSRSWIMVRALKTYLATEGQEIRAIHAAKAEIEDGQYFELDDVLAEADAIIKGEAA